MEMFNVMKYLLKYGAVAFFAYFICEVAMYFDRTGLLWWLIVPLLIGVNTSIDINKNEKENNEEENE